MGNEQEPIDNSSVLVQVVAWRAGREPWTIEMSGERRSGKSVAPHDDDDDDDAIYKMTEK